MKPVPSMSARARARFLLGCLFFALLLPIVVQAAHLEFVAEVRGTILDVTSQRILYRTIDSSGAHLRILDRGTGAIEAIPDVPGREPTAGLLTSRGAFFEASDEASADNIYEWRSTSRTLRLHEGRWDRLEVSPVGKRYVAWPLFRAGQGTYLMLRDVLLNQGRLIGKGSVLNTGSHVSDSGDAAYAQGPSPYNIFRYRSGTSTRLTNATTYSNTAPLTDGINVVYRKQVSAGSSQIVMYGSSGEVVLRPATGASAAWFIPKQDYQPSGGWVAFTRIGSNEGAAYRQVWVRAPDGTMTRLSPFDSDSFINAMRNGQVMFVNGGYLYLGRPGTAPLLISPYASGTQAVWLGDRWHVYYGGVLYRMVF